MKVRFDWQVVDDDDQWEAIAQETPSDAPTRRRQVPWWVWYAVLAAVAVCSLAGFLVVRQRYREAQRRVSFQIQSVIDLEARAFDNALANGERAAFGTGERAAERARDLFLAQQDEASHRWYEQQARRVQRDCWDALSDQEAERDSCAPVLRAELSHVRLEGDTAWVEVVEDDPPVRRVRFYRQTELGWVHTAPRESFWGPEVELRFDQLVVRYHQRDEPHIRPFMERVQKIRDQVCSVLQCVPESSLEVVFTVDTPVYKTPFLVSERNYRGSDKLLLSSPWLSGIPVEDGTPDPQLDRLTHWVTYAIASRAVRASTEQGLNRFQEALLHEYASWHSRQDPRQAPLLGRIIERHGDEALPEVLRSVGQSQTLTQLMAQWLSLSVTEDQLAYFEALLNIEREALLGGRRETFMLLQHQVYPWWVDAQDQLFERWGQRDQELGPPAIRVRRVERIDRRARVALEDPSRLPEGYPPAAKNVVYFEYVDGDWKHASPFSAAIFWAFQVERRPAGTVTPSLTPVPGPNM